MIEKTIYDYIPVIYKERQEFRSKRARYPRWLVRGVISYIMRTVSITIISGKNNKLILPGLFFIPNAIIWFSKGRRSKKKDC